MLVIVLRVSLKLRTILPPSGNRATGWHRDRPQQEGGVWEAYQNRHP